jgi:hypothetical protein
LLEVFVGRFGEGARISLRRRAKETKAQENARQKNDQKGVFQARGRGSLGGRGSKIVFYIFHNSNLDIKYGGAMAGAWRFCDKKEASVKKAFRLFCALVFGVFFLSAPISSYASIFLRFYLLIVVLRHLRVWAECPKFS